MSSNRKDVLILGAGVMGLSVGILLLKKGYKVHIWAKYLPPNTTSDVAAAFWFPYLCEPKDKASEWSGFTLRYLQKHALDDPDSGCIARTVTKVFDKKVGEPWWRGAVKEYRRLEKSELPTGYVDSYQVDSVLMDSSKYMDWLVKQFKGLGGTWERKEVKSLKKALESYELVINCTGLGARELCHDKTVYPIRAQILVVKSNGFDQIISDSGTRDTFASIIPRIHDTVLGGTAQANNWSLKANPQDTKSILKGVQALSPAFRDVEVIQEKVGLRPARSEVRLELEPIGNKYVIHNYGHGGAGFTLSWGCAREVLRLAEQATASQK